MSDWPGSSARWPATGTYLDSLLTSLAAGGEREALVGGGTRLTYAAAYGAVLRTARALASRGLGPGDGVALFTGNRPEAVVAQLATHLIGGRLVQVIPEPGPGELRAFVNQADVAALVFDPALGPRARELAGQVRVGEILSLGPAGTGTDLLDLAAASPPSRPPSGSASATSSRSCTPGAPPAGPSWSRTGTCTTTVCVLAARRRRAAAGRRAAADLHAGHAQQRARVDRDRADGRGDPGAERRLRRRGDAGGHRPRGDHRHRAEPARPLRAARSPRLPAARPRHAGPDLLRWRTRRARQAPRGDGGVRPGAEPVLRADRGAVHHRARPSRARPGPAGDAA